MNDYLSAYGIIIVAFVLSMIISSLLIRKGIPWLKSRAGKDGAQTTVPRPAMCYDIGFWIGVFETVIVFIFIINKEYSGLAIIFGAKEFVRKEEIIKDPAYYLLGTMINFGVAILIVEVALDVISVFI